jgi:hypothetical protein
MVSPDGPARSGSRRGTDWGAKSSLQALASASGSLCEAAYEQFNGSTALTGTDWLSMVRRRSTVRFRKGAPRSGAFFDIEPVTSPRGFQRKEQVSGSAGSRSPSRGRRLKAIRTATRIGGAVPQGALWGQDHERSATGMRAHGSYSALGCRYGVAGCGTSAYRRRRLRQTGCGGPARPGPRLLCSVASP